MELAIVSADHMLYLMYLCLVLVGLLSQKAKGYWLIVAVFASFCIATSFDSADFEIYRNLYEECTSFEMMINSAQWHLTEKGWLIVCLIGHAFGFGYPAFAFFPTFFACLLMEIGAKQICHRTTMAWGLFLIFPLLINCIQLRFFLASSIVFALFPLLLNREKVVRNTLFFIIGVILACSIHRLSAAFLVTPILVAIFRRTTITGVLIMVGTAISMELLILVNGLQWVESIIPHAKYEAYFAGAATITSCISATVAMCAMLIMAVSAKRFMQKNEKAADASFEKHVYTIDITVKMCMTFFCLVPLLFLSADFFRIARAGCMLIYAAITPAIEQERSRRQFNLSFTCIVLTIAISVLIVNPNLFPSVTSALLTFEGIPPLFST